MEWPGKVDFNNATKQKWLGPGKVPSGELWSAANFSFLRVYAAGHMVPLDQPTASLQMLDTFLDGTL